MKPYIPKFPQTPVMPDLSMRWQHMPQEELYRTTKEPNPKEAIKKANTEKFHNNSAAYAFNNEPAATLERIMDYSGKKALGVAASGDQPLIFFQLGLKEYLAFDITQLACFWVELKNAATQNLSREEFIKFVNRSDGKGSRSILSFMPQRNTVYDELREHLSPYAQQFFDEVMTDKNHIGGLLYDNRFFRGSNGGFSESSAPYVSSDAAYRLTTQNMKESAFKMVWMGIDEAMLLTPNEKYDLIFISNILDRWNEFGNSFTNTLALMKERLALTAEARIIGNYQLGDGVSKYIQEAAEHTALKFTPHCKDAYNYWTLQHP